MGVAILLPLLPIEVNGTIVVGPFTGRPAANPIVL